MPTPYKHKRSTEAGVAPTTLQDGEIAINVAAADPKIFFKDSASTIRAFSLASYASATHSHVVADVTDFTTKANVVSVNGITGVVSISHTSVSAAAASHTHAASDVVSGTFDIARIPTVSYTALSNVPTSFTPSAHTHVAADVVNLTSVANVVSVNGITGSVILTNASVSAASAVHSHVAADISDFTSVANVVSVNAKTGVVSISHTDVTAASASHTHAASDVTSGTFDAARLPLATTLAVGGVIVGTGLGVSSGTVSVTYGTTSGTACQGNDSRLSDTRTPTDGSVTTAKIANDAVTYGKIQNVSATDRLLGRSSSGAGVVEEITCTAFGRSLIDDADAAAARTTLSVQPTASPAFTGAPSIINSGASDNSTIRYGNSGQNWYVGLRGDTSNVFAVADDVTFRFQINTSGVITCFGQLLVTAGSASACGVAFSGDPDTGIAQLSAAGANTLSICTNSAERVRVDASGNVGIGSGGEASNKITVAGTYPTSGTVTRAMLCSGQIPSGSTVFGDGFVSLLGTVAASFTCANLRHYVAGQGGFGASSAVTNQFGFVAESSLTGATNNYGFYSDIASASNRWNFYAAGSAKNYFNGETLIGTATDNGAYLLQVNSQIYATNATIATSDARFKTNVQALTDATSVIAALRPVAFDFIPHAERNFATERQVGLIAQEAQSALAGIDYADSVVAQCGDHLGLAYEKLVPVLIKALQESNARIAALEERLNHA